MRSLFGETQSLGQAIGKSVAGQQAFPSLPVPKPAAVDPRAQVPQPVVQVAQEIAQTPVTPTTTTTETEIPQPETPATTSLPSDDYVDELFAPPRFNVGVSPFSPRYMDALSGSFGDGNFGSVFSQNNPFTMQWNSGVNDPFANMSSNPRGGMIGGQAGASGYAALDAHNAEFNYAAGLYGMPANLLKSLLNRESSGDWESNSGSRHIVDQVNGGEFDILPFSGIKRETAASWGLDYEAMMYDKGLQIEGMARIMAGLTQQYGSLDNAIKVYFGGEAALSGVYTDAKGLRSDYYYQQAVNLWRELDEMAGYTGGYDGAGSMDWQASFGAGAAVHDWGEFNKPSTNGLYGYGTQYGLDGRSHTGLDVVGSPGGAYRSPVSGVVTCAGTGTGQGADGAGCQAFGTDDGKGAGRVELLLDNGAMLIFGHSQSAAVRVGQRINPGDLLGTIGYANSWHIHLEARVRDASTPSGWRLVDPRSVIGGYAGGGGEPATLLERMRRWR